MEILVALSLSIICYLIFPICYRCARGKVGENKGKKLALCNSIICEVIITIAGFLIGVEAATNGTMFAQGFLYYFIVKKILIDKSIDEHVFDDELSASNCQADNSDYQDSNNKVSEETNESKETDIKNAKAQKVVGRQLIIKKLQIASVSLICVLALFSIIYPITAIPICSDKIPPITEYQTILLTKLDANQKVYCEMYNNYNYLYVKESKKIIVYRFYNSNSNSAIIKGCATSAQLKSYFGPNIYAGKPSVNFIAPAIAPIGITFGTVMLFAIIILGYLIHRYSEVEIFYLTKKDEEFVALKNNFKDEEINKYDYKKNIKKLFSRKILHNNRFFSIFEFLY